MMRKMLLFGLVLVLSFSVVVILARRGVNNGPAARSGSTTALDPGERTGTADGRVSFTAPKGWTTGPCPPREDPGCARISPRGAAEGDTVTVLTSPANPVEGSPMDLLLIDDPAIMPPNPSMERLTLDGAKAVRMDLSELAPGPLPNTATLPGVGDVMVYGVVPGSTDTFMVDCRHDRLAVEMRAGCDLIVKSLRFPR
ncbi:hypothetical protein AB0F59_22750 [Micromonospora lupini]|uniref:hypothetical protein n=1 Tax=Micromonospora lupini TaxID=285679 RepID=UPI0033FCA8EB